MVLASKRAARDSGRTQFDVIRGELAVAEKIWVGIENGEREHFTAVGNASRTGRLSDDRGSGLRETRPRCALVLCRQREAWTNVSRAATTKAAVHRDAEVPRVGRGRHCKRSRCPQRSQKSLISRSEHFSPPSAKNSPRGNCKAYFNIDNFAMGITTRFPQSV